MTRRMLLQAAAAAPRSPYVDWSWDKWREITSTTPVSLTTKQSGQAALSALVQPGMKAADWPTRRVQLRRVIDLYVGEPPPQKPPLEARIVVVGFGSRWLAREPSTISSTGPKPGPSGHLRRHVSSRRFPFKTDSVQPTASRERLWRE